MGGTTFAILSFEGPDVYSHAGGLGTRVTELSKALAGIGYETHLFFVGDPKLPSNESHLGGKLQMHRWCQWISQHHPNGVYDGEEGKLFDWDTTLPLWLESEFIAPRIAAGESVVFMAEEWQTTGTVIRLNEIIQRRGWQANAHILWNANNLYSFDRIDWDRLKQSATITTVSRYMKQVMVNHGVDARVIPNGIPEAWTQAVSRSTLLLLSNLLRDRLTLVKVARWDPDKQWDVAVDATVEMKRRGLHPLFLARGGYSKFESAIIARAIDKGLNVAFVEEAGEGVETLVDSLRPEVGADMIVM